MGHPWGFHETTVLPLDISAPMGLILFSHGTPMGLPWDSRGSPWGFIVLPRTTKGTSHGTSLLPWDVRETSIEHS